MVGLMFYTEIDVINAYKAAKGQAKTKSVPKVAPESLKNLHDLTNLFNTRWSNVDPSGYMKCGIELWKGFSYQKFLDKRILDRYIKKDKRLKRNPSKETLIASFDHIKSLSYTSLSQYCFLGDPVADYINNKICSILMGYLLYSGIYKLKDATSSMHLGTLICNKKDVSSRNKRYKRFIEKMDKEHLMKKTEDKPYMDKPKADDKQVKDQLLYGNGETVEEKKKKQDDYKEKMLNE